MHSIKELVRQIAPLNRYNVSPGLDKALELLQQAFPETDIHSFKSGSKAWDWTIPQKWDLASASLTADGHEIFSHNDDPVRVWSGSWPTKIDSLSYTELLPHLLCDEAVPDLIPWNYRYYQHSENFWGFSVTKEELQALSKSASYQISIDSAFYDDDLRTSTIRLDGDSEDIFVISSDICHPGQANDSLSGVAASLMVYEQLRRLPTRHYTYLFTFQTEMIGTIAFLAANEDLISRIQYGMFTEMLGTPGNMVLQHSLSRDTRVDAISLQVLLDRYGSNIECKGFLDGAIVNDELILNHVGVHVPTIALNRGTFKQYHTSGDTFALLDWDLISDAAEAMLEICLRMDAGCYRATDSERIPPRRSPANRYEQREAEAAVAEGDFIPVPKFKGPIYLSGRGLYVDWREDPSLNRIIDRIMVSMNGTNACSDIARYCGVDLQTVVRYVRRFAEQDLISIQSI